MSDIEKIKEEIERRKREIHATLFNDEFDRLLSFIDSLQDEPSDEDLEKAAIIYINTPRIKSDKDKVFNEISRNHEYMAFIAGANWQKEQFEKNRLDACDKITKEEYDLETALLDKYIKEYNRLPMFADAIKFGMELQKERDFKESLKSDNSRARKIYEKGKIDGMELQKERDHDACLSCENSRDVIFYNGIKHAIEQMKKEAVEGVVCKQRDSSQATWIELAPNSLPAFDDCEPVKCIILKDE